MQPRRLALCLLALAAPACSRIPPETAQVMVPTEACMPIVDDRSPLVVDWTAEDRTDLEVAMREGVAVVKVDCHTVRVLPGCRIAGDYGFIGVARKDQAIRLADKAEIRVNLPRFGEKLAAGLPANHALDVGLVMVGKMTTTLSAAAPERLAGRCAGATHFVRSATVGALAVVDNGASTTSTVAELFERGASGISGATAWRNGDPNACSAARPDAKKPPERCAAPLRLHLVAIGGDPARQGVGDASCPKDMVFADGKCTTQSTSAHQCKKDDFPGCVRQCDAGNVASCNRLGAMYTHAENGAPRDVVKASLAYERACNGGDGGGCSALGYNYNHGQGVPIDAPKGVALYRRSCDLGFAMGCSNLGFAYATGRGTAPDKGLAVLLFRRACDGGSTIGCGNMGISYMVGNTELVMDKGKGVQFLKRGCDGEDALSCAELGVAYERGQGGLAVDERKAVALYKWSCEEGNASGNGRGCQYLGASYKAGEAGLAVDAKKAVQYFKLACDKSYPNGCSSLGKAHEDGYGDLAANAAKAEALYDLACRLGSQSGCTNLAKLRP